MERNTLSDLCTDLFLLAMQFRDARQCGHFESMHGDTLQLFARFEEECNARRLPAEDIRLAKYALAAFVDETVLHSRQLHKERWADNPLQLEFFGTYLAGEIFFDYLDEIRKNAEAKTDLLEIYYLCLLLGFKGKYGVGNEDKLPLLIDTVANDLQRVKPFSPGNLSPHGRIPDGPQIVPSSRLPRWVVYTCWAVAILSVLLYLFMFFGLHSGTRSLQENMPLQISERSDGGEWHSTSTGHT